VIEHVFLEHVLKVAEREGTFDRAGRCYNGGSFEGRCMNVKLSVNVNKVALLRNSRGGDRPSVVEAARVALDEGCHGITVHPRPDERHIRPHDVHDLAALLRDHDPQAELNIEGYPGEGWLALVHAVRPTQATLVPDEPGQLTSDHGFDFKSGRYDWLSETIAGLREAGFRVSVFLDPDMEQVALARRTGADRIELYTEAYARAFDTPDRDAVYAPYHAAAVRAETLGLGLNAGHDLNLDNLTYFAARTPGLLEVSIGHALICDALEIGLAASVRAYVQALAEAERDSGEGGR